MPAEPSKPCTGKSVSPEWRVSCIMLEIGEMVISVFIGLKHQGQRTTLRLRPMANIKSEITQCLILVCTGFPRTLTRTIYISAIFSTLNPILSIANLSRLECVETQCIRITTAPASIAASLTSSIPTYCRHQNSVISNLCWFRFYSWLSIVTLENLEPSARLNPVKVFVVERLKADRWLA